MQSEKSPQLMRGPLGGPQSGHRGVISMTRKHWIWVALGLAILALWFVADAPQRWAEWRRGQSPSSTVSESLPGQ